jgi:hypothetical protein
MGGLEEGDEKASASESKKSKERKEKFLVKVKMLILTFRQISLLKKAKIRIQQKKIKQKLFRKRKKEFRELWRWNGVVMYKHKQEISTKFKRRVLIGRMNM